jgi:hypothetical protein
LRRRPHDRGTGHRCSASRRSYLLEHDSLNTPHLGRDLIGLETDPSVKSVSVATPVIKHWKRMGKRIAVLSNKVAGHLDTDPARGSNHYIGEDILQTMEYLGPEAHEEMLIPLEVTVDFNTLYFQNRNRAILNCERAVVAKYHQVHCSPRESVRHIYSLFVICHSF